MAFPTCDDELQQLQDDAPGWRIWRSAQGTLWVATRTVDDDVEPTVIAESAARLRESLRTPQRRIARPLTADQLAKVVRELAR
ncbi:hypothetical protein [Nocardiopsis halophila]|uniref:hypothetical protein n=1 Tax=Nocardiopsis halophila TaxID=141692 RepID=UPI00034ABD8D|nr:hypothetical protein [Nocardiopsis halophila]